MKKIMAQNNDMSLMILANMETKKYELHVNYEIVETFTTYADAINEHRRIYDKMQKGEK